MNTSNQVLHVPEYPLPVGEGTKGRGVNMPSIADKIILFNKTLDYKGILPPGIKIMNPFRNPQIIDVIEKFYRKFYDDNKPRRIIMGINPGRFGAGVTGLAFT